MDTFTDDNKLININKSVDKNKEAVPSLVAMHALSGCDRENKSSESYIQ